ncbi:MAG TPA: IPT/TIG domain-containing protein, partial [Longimicrobium sp.]
MPIHRFSRVRCCGVAMIFLAAACGDRPSNPVAVPVPDAPAGTTAELDCTAVVATGAVTCGPRVVQGGAAFDRRTVGGQGTYVRITSSNVTYASEVFAFDVVVQNSSNLPMATDDGTTPDAEGVRVVIPAPPAATSGTGDITVANESGRAVFTGSEPQDYFQYGGSAGSEIGADGILTSGEISAVKRWQFNVPASVTTFSFTVWVATHMPAGTIETIAPQVSSFSASPLVPGQTVTITGINFDPTPANNTVNIGGVSVTPSAATATSLTVTVPCVKTGPVAVDVARGSLRGSPRAATLQGFQRTLAVGEVAVVTNAAEVACNEITSSGTASRYVVAVYNTSTTPTGNAPVVVSGDGTTDAAQAPAEMQAATDRPVAVVVAPRSITLAEAARGRAEAN